MEHDTVRLAKRLSALNGGYFVSRGKGTHPTRTIDTFELIIVDQGRLCMFEEDRQFDLTAGQSLLLEAGKCHGGTDGYPPDLRFYWLHFTPGAQRLPAPITLPKSTAVVRPDRMAELFRIFLADQEENHHLSDSADHLLALMLIELTRPAEPARPLPSDLATQAKQRIETDYARNLTTWSLAQELRCNPDYLGRVFRRAYGSTVTDAIQARRLQQALRLLLNSTRNIDEIALACGFSDAGYFRRLFKRRYKHSPRQHRAMYANVHVNTENGSAS